MSDTIYIVTDTKTVTYDGDMDSAVRYAEQLRAKRGLRVSVLRGALHICTFLSPEEIRLEAEIAP